MLKKTRILPIILIAGISAAIAGCGKTGTAAEAAAEASAEVSAASSMEAETDTLETEVRVGSLKGPTTIGLVNLMNASDNGEAEGKYTFEMQAAPDAVASEIVGGDLDIALIPSNMASILYNKTKGGIRVIDINTLGVLDCVTGDESIRSVKDLSGKTVYATGQGATPEYTMNYLLEKNGVADCTLEFRSEPTEVAAILAENPEAAAILPQPFVTAAEVKNDTLKTAFSLTDEWDSVTEDGSKLITGVTVVRTEFLEENKDAVDLFLKECADSTAKTAENPEGTAELVEKYGIIEKAPVALKALPSCNIVYIDGKDMKTSLSGFLSVLKDQNPESVGGALPEDDFYYAAE